MSAMKTRTWFCNNLSAEPAVLLYSFVIFLYAAGMPNLIQQKVCSPDSPPPVDFVCNDTALVAQATDIVTVRSTLKQSLPAIILLIAGSWRDSTNLNKPIIYLALFWEIVGICIQIFSYLSWTSSPWKTSIAEGIINGLGGGSTLFFVGTTCAITDSTQAEDRTTRFTLVFAGVSFGACLAFGVSGYCLTYMGYTWFLIFTISLHLATGVLIMIFVKDKKNKEKKGDFTKMLNQLKSAVKRRPNIIIIWFMIFASCSITVISLAESNIYQYYLQQTFGYTIKEVGLYTAYRLMIGSVGSIIVPPVVVKLLKWSDFKIGILCSLVTTISCISMVFAATTFEIKIFALLDITKMFLFGLPKSIISKCVNEDEIGMFVSFCLIGESILPIFIFYLYDVIYTATSTMLPGAFYLASAAILTILFIFYSISACTYIPLETYEGNKNVPEVLENCGNMSQQLQTSTSPPGND
ncbi:unnamed protein product [Nezara viridula]|uniref:Uncharacterized protein n=1 Tax=Nezara viridula TaxID=85310 RepID=A0A9P0MPT5_NEZVI|nr:unnamed protein product [Nezara viridula]